MKNRKIYKIITAAVMIALLFSIATVNASAFENVEGGYVEISGDQDRLDGYSNIYGDSYALINCGLLDDSVHCSDPDPRYYEELTPLTAFLDSLEDCSFVSPNNVYTREDYGTLKYIEFFLMNDSAQLINQGVYPVGLGMNVTLGRLFIQERIPSIEYSFGVTSTLYDSIYFGAVYYLVAACYFDDLSPYDDVILAPELIENKQQLENDAKDDAALIEKLTGDLTTERAVHEQRVTDLRNEISDLEAENLDLSSQLFEKENANALDQVFTGTSQGLISIIREVGQLGYSPSPGINITVGSIITISVIAALVLVLLRLAFGGGGKSGG